jgi:hypothetical protein
MKGSLAISVVLIIFLSTSCRSSEQGSPVAVSTTPAAPTVATTVPRNGPNAGTDRFPENYSLLPSATLRQLEAEGISDFQRDLLADGHLTIDEYERAYLAFVECARGHGIVIDPADVKMNGLFLYWHYIAMPAELVDGAARMADCRSEYLVPLSSLWEQIAVRLYESLIPVTREWTADCLHERGFAVRERAFTQTNEQFIIAVSECTALMMSEFDVPASWGYSGDGRGR